MRITLSRALLILGIVSSLSTPAVAQNGPDSLTWVLGSTATTFNLYDRSGTIAVTFPQPSLLPFSFLMHGARVADGSVWLSDSAFGSLYQMGPGGLVQTLTAASGQEIAPHPGGGFWLATIPSIFGGVTLELRDSSGIVIQSFLTLASSLSKVGLACDRAGNAWIADANQVLKYDSSGTLLAITTPPASMSYMTLDHQDQLWVGSGTNIGVISNSGAVLNFSVLPGFQQLITDPNGRVRALITPPSGIQTLDTIDPLTLTTQGSLPLSVPGGAPILRVRFDPMGQIWCVDGALNVWLLDAGATSATLVDTLVSTPSSGPLTSLTIATLLPTSDSDLDGANNTEEIQSGSDCFDTNNSPLVFGPTSIPTAGQTTNLGINAPLEAGYFYLTGASFTAANPGLPLSPFHVHVAPIEFDALLAFWLSPANSTLPQGPSGVLDASGQAVFPFVIPPGTSGLSFVLAAFTINPTNGTPGRLSPAVPLVIQ